MATSKAHLDVELGAAYEGAPGHLHGGYGALVLDHLFGDVASYGNPDTVAVTGTITYRYQRPTRLAPLRAEAEIQNTDGRKIFVAGHLADAEGVTVTAEGCLHRAAALTLSAAGGRHASSPAPAPHARR